MEIEQHVVQPVSMDVVDLGLSPSENYKAVLCDLLGQLAALPPWAQEMREEEAIIALLEKRGERVDGVVIEKMEGARYLVKTLDHVYTIQVVYEPMEEKFVGPAKFHLEICSEE